ncbi:MAG TPA: amino acid racemase [Candidatus Binataceae bacterium]|nr:amino acid racemase [Candidatus Binataceae bacterium]
MAQHVGIVAVSAEGAALCYRTICVEGAAAFGAHNHPEITMHTIALARYMERIDADDWKSAGELILRSARKLAEAGADFLICPDNTLHQAIDAIIDKSPLPWLHIASEVAAVAKSSNYGRVGVLGTKYLMEGPVYPPKLAAAGIAHEIPSADDRERINQIIFEELVYGRFEQPSRQFFQDVITKLKARGCDAVALSCTEIPLLISEADSRLPILDSTRILARAALREASK